MHQHLTAARAKCMYSQSNKQIKKHILEKKETENPLTAHLWLSSPPSTSSKQPFVSFPPSHEGDHLLIKDHLLSYSSVCHCALWCPQARHKCHSLVPKLLPYLLIYLISFAWKLQITLASSLLREGKVGHACFFISPPSMAILLPPLIITALNLELLQRYKHITQHC
ncbi:hypothetical protein Peur_060231 [Populus x canadensis]